MSTQQHHFVAVETGRGGGQTGGQRMRGMILLLTVGGVPFYIVSVVEVLLVKFNCFWRYTDSSAVVMANFRPADVIIDA